MAQSARHPIPECILTGRGSGTIAPTLLPRILSALLLLLTAFPCPAKAAAPDPFAPHFSSALSITTIPMTNDGNLQWRVWILVNDEPGLFALDSGSELTLITPQFARKIGVLPASYVRDGKIIPPRDGQCKAARLTSLQMTDFLYTEFFAPVVDLDHLNGSMRTRIDGILGQNILGLTRCRFDWRKNILTLDTASALPPTNALLAKVIRGRLFIPARINGQPVEFGLDTGSYSTCITPETLRHLKIPRSEIELVESPRIDIYGAARLRQTKATLDTLEFCGQTRRREPAMTWSHNVLGMDQLQRWKLTFDARGGWMALEEFPP